MGQMGLMRPRLAISRSAVELIKAFEGFRPQAAKLDDGRWTIGYGHTATAREGAEIAEPDAEALLLYDLIQVSHAVNEYVYAPLNQNEFDALVAFAFNIGVRNFRGSTTLRRLNEGRFLEAAIAMEMWRKADVEGERIVVDALVRRRAAEKALFLRPIEGWTPAPSSMLQPKMDYDALSALPLQSPLTTRTALGADRARAELAPDWMFEALQGPSPSEAAAEAITRRLESLLSDPAQPADAPSPAPPPAIADQRAPAPDAEAEKAPLFAAAPHPPPKTRGRDGAHPALLFVVAGAGIALFVVASVWGGSIAGLIGAPAPLVGLLVGGVGAVVFALAAYFLLERLGLPRPPVGRDRR